MANSSLAAIRTKIRRLCRVPSVNQMTDADIDEYVNTFIQYDFPEHLRLFSLHQTFTFTTNVGQDQYPTDAASLANVVTNPLFNFNQSIITVNPPVYVGGNESMYTQDRTEFFRIYPPVQSVEENIGLTGDGVTLAFAGSIPAAGGNSDTRLLQGNIVLSSVDTLGENITMVDVPVVDNTTGYRFVAGNLYPIGQQPATPPTVIDLTNSINYQTGAFTVTFPNAPDNGAQIIASSVPVQLSRPNAILYYNNTFTVRPVPDKAYPITFEVYVRPSELLSSNQSPQLEQWWQYIAYGAAKKIFEDRSDPESIQQIMPEFKQQERLVLRRTIVQQSNERVATIYTNQLQGSYGPGFFNGVG